MILLVEWKLDCLRGFGPVHKTGFGYVSALLPKLCSREEEVHQGIYETLKRTNGDRRGIKVVILPYLSQTEAIEKVTVWIPGGESPFLEIRADIVEEKLLLGEIASWDKPHLRFFRRIEGRGIPPRYQFV